MNKILLTLTFITLCSCGVLPNNSKHSSQSGECPEQPDVELKTKDVQEIALTNQMSIESGQVNQTKSVGYTFEAKENQGITYKTSDDICLWIFNPENEVLASNSNTLPKEGKYIIQVTSLKGSTTFELAMGLDVVQVSDNNNGNKVTPPPAARPISQEQAIELVTRWKKSKRRIFSSPYDQNLGGELLTGKAYRDNIRKADGTESSIDWLKNNNSYYTYGSQSIDNVKDFDVSGSQVTIDVVVSEQRTLCLNGKASSDKNTAAEQKLVRYNLQPDQGIWKIAEYKTIETISSVYNPAASCQIKN